VQANNNRVGHETRGQSDLLGVAAASALYLGNCCRFLDACLQFGVRWHDQLWLQSKGLMQEHHATFLKLGCHSQVNGLVRQARPTRFGLGKLCSNLSNNSTFVMIKGTFTSSVNEEES
jgi:hypothetical protein